MSYNVTASQFSNSYKQRQIHVIPLWTVTTQTIWNTNSYRDKYVLYHYEQWPHKQYGTQTLTETNTCYTIMNSDHSNNMEHKLLLKQIRIMTPTWMFQKSVHTSLSWKWSSWVIPLCQKVYIENRYTIITRHPIKNNY